MHLIRTDNDVVEGPPLQPSCSREERVCVVDCRLPSPGENSVCALLILAVLAITSPTYFNCRSSARRRHPPIRNEGYTSSTTESKATTARATVIQFLTEICRNRWGYQGIVYCVLRVFLPSLSFRSARAHCGMASIPGIDYINFV